MRKMIQREFADVVFEFAKRVSGVSRVQSAVLFGSVAKGEADARSDVDFLIVFDSNKPVSRILERKLISEIALDLEKKFNRNISLVFTNRNFDGLDRQFAETVFREGLILYGGVPHLDAKKLKLEPYVLICFSLRKMSKPDKMRIKRALYGHRTIKRYKGKTYTSEVVGLVERLGGKRAGIASVLVPAKNYSELVSVLEMFKAEYEKIDVWVSKV